MSEGIGPSCTSGRVNAHEAGEVFMDRAGDLLAISLNNDEPSGCRAGRVLGASTNAPMLLELTAIHPGRNAAERSPRQRASGPRPALSLRAAR